MPMIGDWLTARHVVEGCRHAAIVVAGDRAELLEHGTYMGVVFITAAFVALTQFRPFAASQALAPRRGLVAARGNSPFFARTIAFRLRNFAAQPAR